MRVSSVQVAAAGKALILGEYAVLYGHPALAQALERKMHCNITWQPKHNGQQHRLLATPLQQQAQAFSFTTDGKFQWLDKSNDQRLPLIAPLFNMLEGWPALIEQHDASMEIVLDSSALFHHTGDKLGLGSSAALTVALFKAWYQLRYPHSAMDPDQWLNNLINIHRRLQHGQGSGVDIAASLYGGLVHYRITRHSQQTIAAEATAMQWPEDLEVIWIWLGKSASTRHLIADIELFRSRQPQAHRRHIDTMAGICHAGIQALAAHDSSALQQAIAAYGEAMHAFGVTADAGIYTDDHRRLAAMARESGIAFKPSGAGGGDIALAAATDTMALAQFARQCHAAGYELLS